MEKDKVVISALVGSVLLIIIMLLSTILNINKISKALKDSRSNANVNYITESENNNFSDDEEMNSNTIIEEDE